MNKKFSSSGMLYAAKGLDMKNKPDVACASGKAPSNCFVLCRDGDGLATAVYGNNIWDFNPYRLSAVHICKVNFAKVFKGEGEHELRLIDEAKYIMYSLIYYGGGGRTGALSATTLGLYWVHVLRGALRFCYAQRAKPMVGIITLGELFTIPVYLAAFLRELNPSYHKVTSAFLSQMIGVGARHLGYEVVNPQALKIVRPKNKQHPVIPTRFYLQIINVTGALLDQICPNIKELDTLICKFSDEHYGIGRGTQKSRGLGGKRHYRPDLHMAIKEHGLHDLFKGEFECQSRLVFQRIILKLQYVMKTVIQLYTGMREQEVMRMSYNCISEVSYRTPFQDPKRISTDLGQCVSVLSTTTKYSGYKMEGRWLAPKEVTRAVEGAQAICRGLATLYGIDVGDECPLFLSPSVIGFIRGAKKVAVANFVSEKTQLAGFSSMLITAEDLAELSLTDQSRDFWNEPAYQVGQPWPLTGHQYRRSLAFYGSSSGFVSLPTLRSQFKHLSLAMARYYANGFNKLRTMFGYYDQGRGEFVLPKNHIAYDYQMAIPMSVANQLIADLLHSDAPQFGGVGTYVEKQRGRVLSGEISVEELRADTQRRVKNGDISFRETLLGGCTKFGRCNSFLLGDFLSCLTCESAVIKLERIEVVISDSRSELLMYPQASGERQIVEKEIERLSDFLRLKTTERVGVELV